MQKSITAVRDPREMGLDSLSCTGIWIDVHEAHVIRLRGGDVQVCKVAIDRSRHKATLKQKHHGSRFSDRPIASERNEEEKLRHERQLYLRRVMDAIGPVNRVVLFGPALMKHELQKEMMDDARWRDARIDVHTTDRMTPNQRLAWVKRYFG
jgi:hypothetical protein